VLNSNWKRKRPSATASHSKHSSSTLPLAAVLDYTLRVYSVPVDVFLSAIRSCDRFSASTLKTVG
jgi:hypothetical protein